jgi:predicted site-specific integrase-resolvase
VVSFHIVENDLIPLSEAAAIANRSEETLRRWIKSGRLTPAAKAPGLRGAYLLRRADVLEIAA